MPPDTIEPTEWQQRVLSAPESFNLFLGGGRGGSKSTAIAFLILQHVVRYESRARVLYVRRTHAAVEDFASILRMLFTAAYGNAATYNSREGFWKLPNGAFVELSMLADASHYARYQGRSYSLICVDEATQWADPKLLDLLRSNLRAPDGVPTRMVLAANPGDVGHQFVAKRYVLNGSSPWVPYEERETGAQFISCPSTYLDNPHIDQEAYRREIAASCAGDPELLKAWLKGDWAVARGAFFADVLDESRNALDPELWTPEFFLSNTRPQTPEEIQRARTMRMKEGRGSAWEFYLAHDFGVSAPSVTYVCVRSPGREGPDGRFYPRGSVLLLDELATHVPYRLNEGLGWTVPHLAEAITELATKWGMRRPQGVADDAFFARSGAASGSIASEFGREGVYWRRAEKRDRVSGWQRMRTMLQDAGKPDRPGLYVSRACEYFWQTAPFIARDPRRPDDVDTRGADHGVEAARYALGRPHRVVIAPLLV